MSKFQKEADNLMRFSNIQGQIERGLFRSILKVQEYSKREFSCFKISNEAPKEPLLARNRVRPMFGSTRKLLF